MKIVIHAGFFKTATTTIQSALQSSSAGLLTSGILYPQTGLRRNTGLSEPSSMGHHLLFHAVRRAIKSTDQQMSGALAAVKEKLESEIRDSGAIRVVVSTELLAGAELRIKKLFLDYFSAWPAQVKVVYAVALPHLLAESMVKQVMKFGREPVPMVIAESLATRLQKDIEQWDELAGPDAVEIVYFSKQHYTGFLERLYGALGVDSDRVTALPGLALNAAVSRQGLILRQVIYRQLEAYGISLDRKFRDVLEIEFSAWEASLPAEQRAPMRIFTSLQQRDILDSAADLKRLLESRLNHADQQLMCDDWDSELMKLGNCEQQDEPLTPVDGSLLASSAVELSFRLMKFHRVREAAKAPGKRSSRPRHS
jgi:hypothetical protein